MTHYFGFEPSDKLATLIDEAQEIVDSGSDEPYYPYRNKISHLIGRELIENLLINLIEVIPDAERKARMTKLVHTVESATDTMLNILLGKDKNKDVLPNLDYLKNETLFNDNEGNTRIGFVLTDEQAKIIHSGFDAVTEDSVNYSELKKALKTMNHAVIDHFVTRFSETLPLGMIKRKAVPVGKAGINKALDIAINKLLPQLNDEALNRLVGFYRPYIINKD